MKPGLDQALQLFQSGKTDEAEVIARAFLGADPEHPGAMHLLGLCLARRGASSESIAILERALAAAPEYVEAHYNLGKIYLKDERRADAERCFRRVIALAPRFAPAHGSLGMLFIQSARLDEAIASLRVAIGCDPSVASHHKNLGDALWMAGREAEAMPHHEAAVERWPGAPDVGLFEHMWQTYAASGRHDRALAVAEKWLEGDPDSPIAKHCQAASAGLAVPERASDGYVEHTFDTFAPTFDEQLEAVGYRAPALVHAAVARLRDEPVGDVLDGGCGTGLCGALLRPLASRLVGVDLSGKMLERARARGCYDEVAQIELTAYLGAHPAAFDLIVSADTLIYFGDLVVLVAGFSKALRPGGHLVVTVEKSNESSRSKTFELLPHGRYAHRSAYVTSVMQEAGLELLGVDQESLRQERGVPVTGLIVSARKPLA